jgi:HAD superfamily hydrolase (TIGR01509 family)
MGLIKTVIFDLGRVLVNVHVGRLTEFFCKEAGVQDALPRIMADPLMSQYSTGKIDSRQFHRALCSQYGLDLPFDEFVLRWCDIFSPMDGIEPIVDALSRKVKLGLLSDTDPLHWEYIKSHYPLMRYFPNPTLSFEAGVMKPHPAIYAAAAKHVETLPAECLFVDDLEKNIQGARLAGMTAIRFEGVEHFRNGLEETGLL